MARQARGNMMRIELSPLELDSSAPLRRTIPRSPEHRQPGYEIDFDFLTVFYDCFASVDDCWFVCVGPPLYDLEGIIFPALDSALFGNAMSQALVERLDRHVRLRFPAVKNPIKLPCGIFRQEKIPFQPNFCELFKG